MLLETMEVGTNRNAGGLGAVSVKSWGFLLGPCPEDRPEQFPLSLQQYLICIREKDPGPVSIGAGLSLYECVRFPRRAPPGSWAPVYWHELF